MGLPLPTSTLQLVDRWIGIPVCAVLSLVRKLAHPFASAPGGLPRRILFVKFAEQGSTVLAGAAVRRAVEMVGRGNVFFVVFVENRFIVDVMGLVPPENVITISHNGLPDMVRSALRALARIRSLGIDAAVDMEFFSRSSAALTFLTGARLRAGFHTFYGEGPYRGDLMTHRLLYNPYLHTTQIFRMMVEALEREPLELPTFGLVPPPVEDDMPQITPPAEDLAAVREMLEKVTGRQGPRMVLLNPNASDLLPLRRWQTSRYVELAKRLLEKFPDIHIGMTGAPEEAGPIGKVAAAVGSPRCVSLAGKTTMSQLLVLYSQCEVLVTNDSGPAHFASLTPIHVITLFGPETPRLFGARTPRSIALWAGIACSPCVNAYNNRQSPCRNNLCMQAISVDQVFTEVCRVLELRASA
jgi:ADP-heptose:LPS heptosyltransferase